MADLKEDIRKFILMAFPKARKNKISFEQMKIEKK